MANEWFWIAITARYHGYGSALSFILACTLAHIALQPDDIKQIYDAFAKEMT